jgi:hypothetical protein
MALATKARPDPAAIPDERVLIAGLDQASADVARMLAELGEDIARLLADLAETANQPG